MTKDTQGYNSEADSPHLERHGFESMCHVLCCMSYSTNVMVLQIQAVATTYQFLRINTRNCTRYYHFNFIFGAIVRSLGLVMKEEKYLGAKARR